MRIRQQEVTSTSSWQAYGDAIHLGRLRFANTLNAAEADEIRSRTAMSSAAWQRWGKHCMGFVGYITRQH